MKIFPNPFADLTTISFTQRGDYSISLYDIEGKLIHLHSLTNDNYLVIEKNDFSPGTYLINITGDISYNTLLVIQ